MANRLLLSSLRQVRPIQKIQNIQKIQQCGVSQREKIGNREIVGYGFNGQPSYADMIPYPFPAIRFKETTPAIQAIREKEKGDWKSLSVEEKKTLYRASFRLTFAELKAPTGEWKSIAGVVLVFVSMGVWLFLAVKKFVNTPLPDSFKEENQILQLKRMIGLRVNPIDGLTSKWDYENNTWKK